MSQRRRDLLEFLSPGRVRRSSIPPLEAGLRPNTRLDDGEALGRFSPLGVDDVVIVDGTLVVSAGRSILRRGADGLEILAELQGAAGAMAAVEGRVVVAVDGHGLVSVGLDGSTAEVSNDPRVQSCVTAIALADDGALLVCIGSTVTDEWPRNLVAEDSATGLLLRVFRGRIEELDRRLAWPSGVCVDGEGGFILAVSVGHRLERRTLAQPDRRVSTLLENLPGYPGRIRPASSPGEWWVAVPYLRNRATELVLEHDDLVAEMVANTTPDSWLVPCLSIENVYRSALQVGSVRVLGEIKPWAPSRTYGLVFRVTSEGRIVDSAHSRTGGLAHGITGIVEGTDGNLIVASQGAGTVIELGGSH